MIFVSLHPATLQYSRSFPSLLPLSRTITRSKPLLLNGVDSIMGMCGRTV
jgi:hypothetical protein